MKVKKYTGDTIQDTIFKVKADLGADAIIINTRKYKTGGFLGFFTKAKVEVIAALEDKDIAGESKALQEISELKGMLSDLNYSWQSEKFVDNLSPELARLFMHFCEEGVNSEFAKELVISLQERKDDRELLSAQVRDYLRNFFGNPAPIDLENGQKVVAFIGPTGVGKTTTIAKIAAHFALEENYQVGLITADTYRIAAVQQLETYSDIIDIPLQVVYNQEELASTLNEKFADFDLVLVDTPGSSWNDKIQLGRLRNFTDHELVDEIHLLLSPGMKDDVLAMIVDNFGQLEPDKMILTKLDETNSFGNLINLKYEQNLPFSYLTIGQNVPDDIKEAETDCLIDYLLGDCDV